MASWQVGMLATAPSPAIHVFCIEQAHAKLGRQTVLRSQRCGTCFLVVFNQSWWLNFAQKIRTGFRVWSLQDLGTSVPVAKDFRGNG